MAGWVIWVIAAGAFGVGEMLTMGFFLAPFAIGAALAGIVDLAGAGGIAAWVVFVVASVMTLGLVRPIALSHLREPPPIRNRAAVLGGKDSGVLGRIANRDRLGLGGIGEDRWA